MTRAGLWLLFGAVSACSARMSEPPPPEPHTHGAESSRATMGAPPAPSSATLAPPPPAKFRAGGAAGSSAGGAGGSSAGGALDKFELDEAVDKLSAPVRTAVAAEVVRGDTRLAITWPAFRADGRLLDNDIVTNGFYRKGGAWVPFPGLGRQLDDASSITDMIGGADWTLVRPCGLSVAELATDIPRHAREFDQAHRSGDLDAALLSYVRLTRAFSFEEVAFTHHLPRYLIQRLLVGSTWVCDEAAKTCSVDTLDTTYDEPEKDGSTQTRDVKGVHATFALESCGGKKVVGAPLR